MNEHWTELERLLTQVCADIASQLDSGPRERILDFIGNREFGLAYEEVCWLMENEGIQMADDTAAKLARAGAIMGLEQPPGSSC